MWLKTQRSGFLSQTGDQSDMQSDVQVNKQIAAYTSSNFFTHHRKMALNIAGIDRIAPSRRVVAIVVSCKRLPRPHGGEYLLTELADCTNGDCRTRMFSYDAENMDSLAAGLLVGKLHKHTSALSPHRQ